MRFNPQSSFKIAASSDPQVQVRKFFEQVGSPPLTYANIFDKTSNDDSPAVKVAGDFSSFSPNLFGKNSTYLSSIADGQVIHINSGDLIIDESVGDNVSIYSAGGGDVIVLGTMGENNSVYTEGEFQARHIGANNEVSAKRITMASGGHGCNLSAKRTVYINKENGFLGKNSMVQALNVVIEMADSGVHVIAEDKADIGFAGTNTIIEGKRIVIRHDAQSELIKAEQLVIARDINNGVVVESPRVEADFVSREAKLLCDSLSVKKFYASDDALHANKSSQSKKPVEILSLN